MPDTWTVTWQGRGGGVRRARGRFPGVWPVICRQQACASTHPRALGPDGAMRRRRAHPRAQMGAWAGEKLRAPSQPPKKPRAGPARPAHRGQVGQQRDAQRAAVEHRLHDAGDGLALAHLLQEVDGVEGRGGGGADGGRQGLGVLGGGGGAGWDGMGRDGMGWDGMGRDGMGWDWGAGGCGRPRAKQAGAPPRPIPPRTRVFVAPSPPAPARAPPWSRGPRRPAGRPPGPCGGPPHRGTAGSRSRAPAWRRRRACMGVWAGGAVRGAVGCPWACGGRSMRGTAGPPVMGRRGAAGILPSLQSAPHKGSSLRSARGCPPWPSRSARC